MLKPAHPAMTLLLGALVAIAPLAMDIYLPSMPAMTRALSATPEQVQMTLSVYMFGWGAAQLFAGPASDRFGRKPALLAGLAVFTLSSVACALSTHIVALIVARFFQAVSMATVVVVPRAVVRDLYEGDRAAHMLSTMMLVLSLAPVLAPLIGAETQVRFGWQASFVVVAVYGAIAWLLVMFALPETLARPDAGALALRSMIANWALALRLRALTGFLLINAFATCGLFAFLAGSTFVFVEALAEGERGFARYFGIVMLGNFAGAWTARGIVIRIGLERMIGRGTALMALSGVVMAALAWGDVRHPLAIALPMLAFMIAYMWTVPQATAGAMTPLPRIAGSVASLMAFAQFVLAAGFAYLVGVAYDGTPRPMATAIAIAALAALASFRVLVVAAKAGG